MHAEAAPKGFSGFLGRRYLVTLLLVTPWLGVAPAHAATLTVPGDYASIQAAVDAASDGDEILVSPGTYDETIEIRSGITLQGPGIDDETAHIQGDNTGSVVVFIDAPPAVLEGFVISGSGGASTDALVLIEGSSPVVRGNLLDGPGPNGIYATLDADPHIDGNRIQGLEHAIVLEQGSDPDITGNELSFASDVALVIGEGCSPLIQDNVFHDNDRDILCNAGNAPSIFGNLFESTLLDTVVLSSTSPTLSDNIFRGALGTALSVEAGAYPDILENWFDGNATGIRVEASSPKVAGNWFTRNTGPATLVLAHSYPTLYQNIYQDNQDAIVLEGSIEEGDASPHILNNTIVGGMGAGIRCSGQAFPAISNNIIAYNADYGVVCQGNSVPTLAYNDVYGNTPMDFGGTCGPSATDMSVDPEFVAFSNDRNPDNDDLHTSPDSPTRDAGNPYPEYNDTDGSRNDLGAYGGPLDPAFVDIDGDGYRVEDGDCNDADPRVYPGAEEVEDGVDNDCDGNVDVSPTDTPLADDDETFSDDDTPGGRTPTPGEMGTPTPPTGTTPQATTPDEDDDASSPGATRTPFPEDDDVSPEAEASSTPEPSPMETTPGDHADNGEGCTCTETGRSTSSHGWANGMVLGLAWLGLRRRKKAV